MSDTRISEGLPILECREQARDLAREHAGTNKTAREIVRDAVKRDVIPEWLNTETYIPLIIAALEIYLHTARGGK